MTELQQHQETSLLTFPSSFTIKVFGKATAEYQMAVLNIIQSHVNDLKENAVRERFSRDKNYLALSITIEAQSKQQLDAIYQALSKEPLVVMAL